MNSNIEALLLLFVERRRPDVGNRRKVVPRPYGTVQYRSATSSRPSWIPECCWGKSCEKLWQGSLSTVDQKSVREVPPYDGWISSKSFFKTPEIVLKKGPFFKTISGRFEDIFKKSGFQNYSNRGTNPIIEDIFKNTYRIFKTTRTGALNVTKYRPWYRTSVLILVLVARFRFPGRVDSGLFSGLRSLALFADVYSYEYSQTVLYRKV